MSGQKHSVAAIALGLVLALTGCSSDAPASGPAADSSGPASSPALSSSAPAPAPQRAAGATIVERTGYSFALPRGWVDLTRTMRKGRPTLDVAVGDATRTDGFASNLVVDVTPIGQEGTDTIDDVAEQVLQSVRQRAPKYAVHPHASVGGLPAAHLSGMHTSGKQHFWLEQFVVVGSSRTIVISFSLAPGSTATERTRLIDTVLRSWMIES